MGEFASLRKVHRTKHRLSPHTTTTMLKIAVCLALVMVAFADEHAKLVEHEVTEIVRGDPSVTVTSCSIQCDAMFNLLNDADEMKTDEQCQACECQITGHGHHCGDDDDRK